MYLEKTFITLRFLKNIFPVFTSVIHIKSFDQSGHYIDKNYEVDFQFQFF